MTKTLDGTAVYAYTTLISCLICIPWALLAEGSTLVEGANAAIAKVMRRAWQYLPAGVL
jgi:solute carrier family 35 protein E1